ncbi:hypothetical protein GF371_01975 [Candidatus Woesearchaeota archaeon]|nr:hypothetical protein [Candidatus Woesearchaeota archaeon]
MTEAKEVQNIIKIEIKVLGRVNQSDIIGAVFGQTEDVLGDVLELRKLQKQNKIGRIEVETEYTPEGTKGIITIPSYMDRTNTVIIAAALETIKKIGPCKANARIIKIENIKEIKIKQIIEHAKKVLEKFMSISVDSQELIDRVSAEVRMSQIDEYSDDKVPTGPSIDRFDELIFVETRNDLKNMLKCGIKNVVAFEDMSKKDTLKKLADKHEVIVFINKGREFQVKKLLEFADVDSYTKPEGNRRIHELESKEIFKAIRSAISAEQIAAGSHTHRTESHRSSVPQQKSFQQKHYQKSHPTRQRQGRDSREHKRYEKKSSMNTKHIEFFNQKKKELANTNQAYVIDRKMQVLGKVPSESIVETARGLNNIYCIIIDGEIPRDLVFAAEKSRIKYLVGDSCSARSRYVNIIINKS